MRKWSADLRAEGKAETKECCARNWRAKRAKTWAGRILAAIGIGGAALTGICCIAPFLVAGLLSVAGLTFILNDAILIGLLVIFVAVTVIGYYFMRPARQA